MVPTSPPPTPHVARFGVSDTGGALEAAGKGSVDIGGVDRQSGPLDVAAKRSYRLLGMKSDAIAVVGRPREFDIEQALTAALKVFWRKGYDGASLTDLTEAMGITRPSLYCAFGNKEALFKRALDLYEREKLAFIDYALAAPSAYDVVERMLTGGCLAYSDPETPGCMGLNSVLSNQGVASEAIRQELADRRLDTEGRLRARFEQAKVDGDLEDEDPAGLALYVMTVGQGIALQAGVGASREALRLVVDTALKACPRRLKAAAE